MKPDQNANQGRGPLPKRVGFRDFLAALGWAFCAGCVIWVLLKATGWIR